MMDRSFPRESLESRIGFERPLVVAYYFPNWHQDPQNEEWFGAGWSEWELLKCAQPRFSGHRQPRTPLYGFANEASPEVASREIEIAAHHGVDAFLVDYYWYEDGPYLSGALDRGLLLADNANDIQFALMWANHELVDIFPYGDPRSQDAKRLKAGAIDRPTFERLATHIISEYFSRDNYLKIDGKPWFSLYEIGTFIEGLGGLSQAVDALQWFRERVVEAGFPGLHLDTVIWGFGVLPTAVSVADPIALVSTFGFDSATSYVWVHHVDSTTYEFPSGDIGRLQDEAFADYERLANELAVPFYPNVTVGWDSSPRTDQGVPFERGRYPFMTVWDQTPAQFESALQRAKEFLVRHDTHRPIVTVNAWNEWTEGSALMPDTHHQYAYLEAIQRVFGPRIG